MTVKHTVSAKIVRPHLSTPVQRERLFALLDAGGGKPITWISSPGGSGKTTLVASYLDCRQLPCLWYQCDEGDADLATFFYHMGLAVKKRAPRFKKPLPLLTPEYFAGIPTFTRRYFESLYSRLLPYADSRLAQRQFVIVLDNYQDVPLNTSFHDMIAIGLSCIPDAVRFVVISRGAPPSPLVRFQANDSIAMLYYGDIRFTLDESRKLIFNRMPSLERKRIEQMHDVTRGWAAGIILMLERLVLCGSEAIPSAEFDYIGIFDYFAAEIFARLSTDFQEFLLKTSLLPTLNVSLTEALTGIKDAGKTLGTLSRYHIFTERLSGSGLNFQYHPLFRKFLINQLNNALSSEELSVLQCETAKLLEQSGFWEDAANLYGESGCHDELSRVVIQYGRELLTQGRSKVLAGWIACLPSQTIVDNAWILYWDGMCSFPVDLSRTRRYLENALSTFKLTGDSLGIYLAWAGIVDTYAYGDNWRGLDDCISDFYVLLRDYPTYPSAEIELMVSSRMLLSLTLRKPDQSQRVEQWLTRVTSLLRLQPSFDIQMDTIFCMSVYYLWKGEYERNAVLLERAAIEIRHRQPSPFALIRIKLMKGIHYWVTAEYQDALQTLNEGLEISAKSGVHIYDSLLWSFKAAAEMAPGNHQQAATSLEKQLKSLIGMENALNLYFYHINSAWHALLAGKASHAAEHMETISATTEQLGTPYYRALWLIGMALISHVRGFADEAKSLILAAHRISLAMKSQVLEWYTLLIDARFLLQEGKETEGLLSLHRALSLGRRHGFVHLEFYQPDVMRYLVLKALEENIEPEYVKGLIKKLDLDPPVTHEGRTLADWRLEEWPFPVKIYTLGRFEIVTDGEPLHFTGKEQKKPLELIKALIARGGREVPIERMTDALWPEADGDLAYKSFETTLGRLRKLLGRDDAILFRSRCLTINRQQLWVDCHALEQLFDTIQESTSDQTTLLCKKALDLFRGPFLPMDSGLVWTAACREKFSNRLLRIILLSGRHHEQAGEWEQAADHYSRGIETDPLAEEFHRRLMICQRNLGNHSDAVKTYQRCHDLLRSELGIEPSPETTSVYTTIVAQS
ncbi:MAG: AAA family ATPase [Desulfuromonadales bacterium]|nr:AAA family ATPase [Desulfuromonadales bacterium]